MSDLKYKVGDRFVSNSGIEVTIIKKNKENYLDPYKIDYLDGDYGYCNDITIDKYYTKIEETKQIGGNHYAELGKNKYGVTMEREDLTELEWLTHAQEEAMDLSIYLQKCINSKHEESNN